MLMEEGQEAQETEEEDVPAEGETKVDDKYLGSGNDDLLIVRGFPKTCKVGEVETFMKTFGEIAGFRMPVQYKVRASGRFPTGKNRGYCFVKFLNKDDEYTFRNKTDLKFKNSSLTSILADRTEQQVMIRRQHNHPTKEELTDFFQEYGDVKDVDLEGDTATIFLKSERQYRVGKEVKINNQKYLILEVKGAKTKDANGVVHDIVQSAWDPNQPRKLSKRERKRRDFNARKRPRGHWRGDYDGGYPRPKRGMPNLLLNAQNHGPPRHPPPYGYEEPYYEDYYPPEPDMGEFDGPRGRDEWEPPRSLPPRNPYMEGMRRGRRGRGRPRGRDEWEPPPHRYHPYDAPPSWRGHGRDQHGGSWYDRGRGRGRGPPRRRY